MPITQPQGGQSMLTTTTAAPAASNVYLVQHEDRLTWMKKIP